MRTPPETSFFEVRRHKVPAAHIREYAQGAATQDAELFLDVKQYIPRSNMNPQSGDITIVVAGGIGMFKELYEPLFEDMLEESEHESFKIRSIWMADNLHSGGSAVLNEGKMGNEPHWFDHSRDILNMINLFRKEIPQPIVGIGHSMGGAQIAYLSLTHPSLFSTLILIEPAIQNKMGLNKEYGLWQARGMLKTLSRETYPDFSTAESRIRGSPYYKRWDPRTLERFLHYSLREVATTPEEEQNSGKKTKIIANNSKHYELAYMYKLNMWGVGTKGYDMTAEERRVVPDVNPEANWLAPLYRTESLQIFERLANLRPSCCFIVGGESTFTSPEVRTTRVAITGTGFSGSGGAKLGLVKEKIVPQGLHQCPVDEHVSITAKLCAEWIGEENKRWENIVPTDRRKAWMALPPEEKWKIDPRMSEVLDKWKGEPWEESPLKNIKSLI